MNMDRDRGLLHRRPSIHPIHSPIQHLIVCMSDSRIQDSKSYEHPRSPSPKFNEQHDGNQSDAMNGHEKNTRSLGTRRPV